jgi:hypothetical protein
VIDIDLRPGKVAAHAARGLALDPGADYAHWNPPLPQAPTLEIQSSSMFCSCRVPTQSGNTSGDIAGALKCGFDSPLGMHLAAATVRDHFPNEAHPG